MCYHVAPFTGAWIEIYDEHYKNNKQKVSLPSRERGLKLVAIIYHIV